MNSRESGMGNRESSTREPRASHDSRFSTSYPRPFGPHRIVCLTEEPTEVLYALGEQ